MVRISISWMLMLVLLAIASSEGVTRIDDLENKIEAIQTEQKLRSLEDAERIRKLEDIILSQKRTLDMANHRMNAMENTIEEMKTSNKRQISMEGRAAFSAYLDHDLDGVTNHQTIAFNKPLYNSDASYDPSTGVFTAPYDGLYLFIYFIGNRHAREVDAELMLNGVKQNEAVAEGVQGAHDTQGGNSAILELSVNDRVWIDTTLGDHVEGQWRFSSFTGVLLYSY